VNPRKENNFSNTKNSNELSEELFKPLLGDVDFEEEIEKLKVIERIIELRKKVGLSRKELGARIGENETFVEKFESKKVLVFDVPLLIRIAHALNCQLEINFRHPEEHRR